MNINNTVTSTIILRDRENTKKSGVVIFVFLLSTYLFGTIFVILYYKN